MTNRQRDALIFVGAVASLYSLLQLRRVERVATLAATALTLDPLSVESLKKRAIDKALDVPFELLTP